MGDVTKILSAIEQGDPSAAEQLLPLVYEELRKLGGTLRITDLNDVCGDIFHATRLIYLNVYDDIHEAIRSGP